MVEGCAHRHHANCGFVLPPPSTSRFSEKPHCWTDDLGSLLTLSSVCSTALPRGSRAVLGKVRREVSFPEHREPLALGVILLSHLAASCCGRESNRSIIRVSIRQNTPRLWTPRTPVLSGSNTLGPKSLEKSLQTMIEFLLLFLIGWLVWFGFSFFPVTYMKPTL